MKSVTVAKAAISMATSERDDEKILSEKYREMKIKTAAVDFGGNLMNNIPKMIERTLVASKKMGLIKECHVDEGAVVGAAREAIMQISAKANGMNVGGKIGIARGEEHISVVIFLSIGLLHLNEVVIGLGHRSIPK